MCIRDSSKRVAEVFQKLEHCDVLEIKTLEPYNAYNAREDRKKKKLPLISPLDIDLDSFQKIVLIFPVWELSLIHILNASNGAEYTQ